MTVQRTVFFVSDRTGITAETLGHSLITQFDGLNFRQVTLPFISTIDKANAAVERINRTGQEEGARPVVFSTMVDESILAVLNRADALVLDFFATFIGPLEQELGLKSTHTAGKAHGVVNEAVYTARIDAMNFALANDDGVTTRNYGESDVVLVGVSRSGKTPTCLYLALQYGIYAANYPLTDEELGRETLPDALLAHRPKLYGLSIKPERLHNIRSERRPDSRYASEEQVRYEIREAETLFRKYSLPFLDTTHSSIEEIATTVLDQMGLSRRFY
ncbi:MAG TPA: pyruvate, water dikinase regulatory protein [Gammaproteobacteria bacterium]|jgi:regulator of PEP synthase PpsR (kinase-PPPase family)|nr:pyruvate, water dikinase regulatory protein [Gammaproteobacteria bacterium]